MADWNAERYHEISSPQQAWGLHLLERLPLAGFVEIDVSLEEAPTPFAGAEPFQECITNVCVRHHLSRLPADERKIFLRELTIEAAADSPPFTLDYWRLNMSARRPA